MGTGSERLPDRDRTLSALKEESASDVAACMQARIGCTLYPYIEHATLVAACSQARIGYTLYPYIEHATLVAACSQARIGYTLYPYIEHATLVAACSQALPRLGHPWPSPSGGSLSFCVLRGPAGSKEPSTSVRSLRRTLLFLFHTGATRPL
ncbi:MAG: hypothetical protein KatS3mg108_2440 [Isosphaeraceae bacterium]|jgi:hypothetical protein|nr:MAG: hypothetical protein KatS3mg108_2440 [Isosphaeraceae bacterium]